MDLTKLVYLTDTISYDPSLPKGIALYRYEATESEEMSLEEGDVVDVLEEADDGWWSGALIVKTGKTKIEGIFPWNYIRKLSKQEFDQIKNLLISGNKNIIIQNHISVNLGDSSGDQQQDQDSVLVDIQIDNETKSYHSMASLSDPLEKGSSSPGGSSLNLNAGKNSGSYEETYDQLKRLSVQVPKQSVQIKLNDIAKEGYLIKKGHIRKNWNVRWFQLKRNVLTYAKSPSEPKLSGTLVLTPDTEIDIATSMKRTNCFQLKIPTGDGKQPFLFVCSAHSTDDMDSWIRALNQAKIVK